MGLHVKHKHGPFIKHVSCVNPNMTRTHLASTHDLFINRLVMSSSRVVSDFATPDIISHTFLLHQMDCLFPLLMIVMQYIKIINIFSSNNTLFLYFKNV